METLSIQFIKMLIYFLAMMTQLMMYCWYGNEIIVKVSWSSGVKFSFIISKHPHIFFCANFNNVYQIFQSSAIKNACYDCDWLESDIRTKRFLSLISERTNKYLFLTAGKFSIVSLQSFGAVNFQFFF